MREIGEFAIFAKKYSLLRNYFCMKIKSISLGGFCNIDKFNIDLQNMNAIVAPNNYGKSNVLEAIIFALKFIKANETERAKMMSDQSYIPINKMVCETPFSFEICGYYESSDSSSKEFAYGFSFEWATSIEQKGSRIISEYLKVKDISDIRFTSLVKRSPDSGAFYVPSPMGRCNKRIDITDQQLIINLLYGTEVFFKTLLSAITNLEIRMVDLLESNMRELCKFFYKLKETDIDNYSILEDAICQIIPNVEKIEPVKLQLSVAQNTLPYRIDDDVYDLRIFQSSNNQDISINRLSSGSRRVICILKECLSAEINKIPLVFYEELENSVHPRLLENVLLVISELAPSVSILTTSHSPYLIRYMKPEQLIFGLPSATGVADFHKIKSQKISLLQKRAVGEEASFGEYMFELMLNMEYDSSEINTLFQ